MACDLGLGTTHSDDVRSTQLSGLLTARRQALGLTAEQAARATGLPEHRYAALERGAGHDIGLDGLRAVAGGLGLTGRLRETFLLLAAEPGVSPYDLVERRRPTVEELAHIDLMDPNSALITDHAWNVLAANASVARLFADPARTPRRDRNLVLWLLTEDAERRFADIGEVRADAVARVRSALAHIPADDRLQALAGRITADPLGARLWRARSPRLPSQAYARRLRHPLYGEASVLVTTSRLPGGLHLVVHHAAHLIQSTAQR
ncbi:helix-turn-helix transcriptional regulator [Streptomyces sp. VRA16 Mangrove soil]|uniref:helix-turn-helix transcriptional regulator n=1 Tax=Streptomyces sp. VRA16 Mangrove soil TaxID=2817434 RepID=UPI001A9F8AAD|nr:helix-turn-helix transcriptional regulator [Streptomyces sp. VRA16 Mangrove soil]MBO1330925.1 helix-turn-helix domain-containing protein [Streptomyces sp. VRA16 Mangrove soil]